MKQLPTAERLSSFSCVEPLFFCNGLDFLAYQKTASCRTLGPWILFLRCLFHLCAQGIVPPDDIRRRIRLTRGMLEKDILGEIPSMPIVTKLLLMRIVSVQVSVNVLQSFYYKLQTCINRTPCSLHRRHCLGIHGSAAPVPTGKQLSPEEWKQRSGHCLAKTLPGGS